MAQAKLSDYARLAGATVIGGAALGLLGIPAGWLSGGDGRRGVAGGGGPRARSAGAAACYAILLSGVGIGSGLTPATIRTLAHYPLSVALMVLTMIGMVAASFSLLQCANGFSYETAFFSAISGALSYVFVIAVPTEADMARIALILIFRLFVLMVIVPIVACVGVAPARGLRDRSSADHGSPRRARLEARPAV